MDAIDSFDKNAPDFGAEGGTMRASQPILEEKPVESVRTRKGIDPRKMIIFSEILKPKYEEE